MALLGGRCRGTQAVGHAHCSEAGFMPSSPLLASRGVEASRETAGQLTVAFGQVREGHEVGELSVDAG